MEGAPKLQQLTTLQRVFDNITRWLSVSAPIVATPSLLKMNLVLSFLLNHRDDLGTRFISYAWVIILQLPGR